jgi:dihydrofolate synthase / folylpolyglutamate synthase
MRTLCTLLGLPQHRFASIHVVGTNGKSSVARTIAALLEAHGTACGAYLSPHSERWSEGLLVRGEEIDADAFALAVERAAAAAAAVERKEERRVTGFELATAAAFLAFASAGVEVAVVEAGLGGARDATNTIPSRLTVLTSVGLDHTRWLGQSEEEIAADKLAVLRDHSTLVLGSVAPAVAALAERAARERSARLLVAPQDSGEAVALAGAFQRRNFALARAAAEAFLGELDPARVAEVATRLRLAGRLELVADDPPAYLDAAHNPPGAAALAEALAELAGARPVVAVLAILADKDARGMVEALAPALARVVCTELPAPPGRASVGAEELGRLCGEIGIAAETAPDLAAAAERGRDRAARAGGVLVVAGSHYALAPARAVLGGQELCED